MERSTRLSLHEAAIELQLAEDTVRNLARQGKLPAQEEGGRVLFRRADVEAYRRRVADTDPAGDGMVNTLVRGEHAEEQEPTAPHGVARPPSGG